MKHFLYYYYTMFYLYHDEHSEIIANVLNEKLVYKMILRQLTKKVGHPVIHIIEWDDVVGSGFYFQKLDGFIELREYSDYVGYIYNGLYYDVVGHFKIIEYKETNEGVDFVDELKKKGIKCNNIIKKSK